MKSTLKKLSLVILTALMLTAVFQVNAFAGTKTVKPKNQAFTTSHSTAERKSKTVKKGTYKVKLSPKKGKAQGYLKFKAPKTGTYTFTVSGLTTNSNYGNGHVSFEVINSYNSNYITTVKVKTNGGKNTALFVATKNATTGDKVYRTLKSRYGKLRLQKNQTVYIHFYMLSTTSFKLNIK